MVFLSLAIIQTRIDKVIEHTVNWINQFVEYVSAHLAFIIFLITVLGITVGWAFFNVSPLQPLEEIAFRQQEYRRSIQQEEFKKRMIQRHLQLADSFLNTLQLESAKAEYDSILELDRFNTSAQLGLLKVAAFDPIAAGEFDPEVSELRLRLIEDELPGDAHVAVFQGMLYVSIEHEKAIDFFHSALAKNPDIMAAYRGLGAVYALQNKTESAISAYNKAINLSPWNQDILNNLAYLSMSAGQYQDAIDHYNTLLGLDRRHLLAHYNVAKAMSFSGDIEGAYRRQKELLRLLGTPSDDLNESEWFFPLDSDWVSIRLAVEKKYYAYALASLSAFLLNLSEDYDAYSRQAQLMIAPDVYQLNLLIRFDLHELSSEMPELAPRIEQFEDAFFKLDD